MRRPFLATFGFVFLLSFWQTHGKSNEPTNAVAMPAPVPADVQNQARERLEQWNKNLADKPDLLAEVTFPEYRLFENWSTLDLDRAIVMDEGKNDQRLRLVLMRKLAGQKRWNDLVKVTKRNTVGSYQVHKLWAHIAQLAAADNELRVIELAGEQVEQNATFDPGSVGAPSRPSLPLSGARFFIAASRLDLMRSLPRSEEQLKTAQRELWFTAGAFSPLRTGFVSVLNHHDVMPKYASLETWNESETEMPWLNPGKDPVAAKAIKSLTWKHIHWPSNVELPKLAEDLPNAWYLRQLEQDRRDVALTYLAIAEGDILDRARLLAVAAPYLRTDQQKQAIELARKWIENSTLNQTSEDEASVTRESKLWLKLEAQAELANAMNRISNSAGDELLHSALSTFGKIATAENSNYHAFSALLRSSAQHGLKRDDLPQAFIKLVDRYISFHGQTPENYGVSFRGIDIKTDISNIAQAPKAYRYPKHEKYYQLVEEQKWLEIVAEVGKLAEGNRAWLSSWGEAGAQSVQAIGLEKTLEWTSEIELPEARFSVEMGAIEEALKPMNNSLPSYFERSSPQSIAPSILWPTNGC